MECPTTFIFDKSLKKYFPNKQNEDKEHIFVAYFSQLFGFNSYLKYSSFKSENVFWKVIKLFTLLSFTYS